MQEKVTIEWLEHYVLALARQLLCHDLGIYQVAITAVGRTDS